MCSLCPHIQLLLGSKITGFFKTEKGTANKFDAISSAANGFIAFPAFLLSNSIGRCRKEICHGGVIDSETERIHFPIFGFLTKINGLPIFCGPTNLPILSPIVLLRALVACPIPELAEKLTIVLGEAGFLKVSQEALQNIREFRGLVFIFPYQLQCIEQLIAEGAIPIQSVGLTASDHLLYHEL